MTVDPAIEALFGRDRALVLGVLANSSLPLSGYAIAKLSGCQRIKVSGELRKLKAAMLVNEVRSGKIRRVWTLTDPGLRRFFGQRVRILSPAELERRTRPSRAGVNAAISWARSIDLGKAAPPPDVDLKEFRRPAAKDRALRNAGLRPSRRAS
jgi:hypothetical protein